MNDLENLAMGLFDGLEANNLSETIKQCIADGSQTIADVNTLIDDLNNNWSSIIRQTYKVLIDLHDDYNGCIGSGLPAELKDLLIDAKTVVQKAEDY